MSYCIEYFTEGGTLKMKLSGAVTGENMSRIARDVLQIIGGESTTRILIDARELNSRLDLGSTYFAIKRYSPLIRKLKVGIIDSEKHTHYHQSFEDMAANNGCKMVFFIDPVEAETWLQRSFTAADPVTPHPCDPVRVAPQAPSGAAAGSRPAFTFRSNRLLW